MPREKYGTSDEKYYIEKRRKKATKNRLINTACGI